MYVCVCVWESFLLDFIYIRVCACSFLSSPSVPYVLVCTMVSLKSALLNSLFLNSKRFWHIQANCLCVAMDANACAGFSSIYTKVWKNLKCGYSKTRLTQLALHNSLCNYDEKFHKWNTAISRCKSILLYSEPFLLSTQIVFIPNPPNWPKIWL